MTYNTIIDDNKRRNILNAQMNPREANSGATQTTNPLTGAPYLTGEREFPSIDNGGVFDLHAALATMDQRDRELRTMSQGTLFDYLIDAMSHGSDIQMLRNGYEYLQRIGVTVYDGLGVDTAIKGFHWDINQKLDDYVEGLFTNDTLWNATNERRPGSDMYRTFELQTKIFPFVDDPAGTERNFFKLEPISSAQNIGKKYPFKELENENKDKTFSTKLDE